MSTYRYNDVNDFSFEGGLGGGLQLGKDHGCDLMGAEHLLLSQVTHLYNVGEMALVYMV